MDMMVLGKCVADHSMKVSEDADALSKRNEDLMREVELLRSSISERMMLLNDVYIEMNEIRGSLDFLLKQVKDLRTAHIEANADQVDMVMRLSEYRRNSRSLCETVCRSNSPVQDLDRPHEDSLAECCTSDELQEDLQRALNTQSFKLSAVTEKLRECESLNNALICECESLKHHLGRYTTVTDELANDMTKVKALLPFVVSHIRSLRSDYRDWCREHEERVQECLDAVATELPHASVEHVDRECETMAWSEHLKSTVMFDRFVEPYESNEVTPIEKGHDSDLINEVSRLYNTNRELSEELCKYRDLCDKQASEIMSMQRALHQAVEQSSSVRDALAVYKHEKVGVMLELESQLSISRDECSALQDQVCRPEISMKEHYSTVSTIANRDCGLHVNEVVSEGDTAMKDLLELRARLNVTDGMDAKFVREVCRSDVGTQTPNCFSEYNFVFGAAESFLHLDKFPSVVFGDSFIPSSSCCNSVHFLHSPIFCPLCFELSELKRSYSSASLCSSFIVDFCELCICVLVIFCSIFIRFLQFSVADVDSDILLELDYLLTNILSFSELSFICPLFGVHSHVFQYFSRLHDLLKLRLFPSCISCRCTNFAGHIFIGNICISCIPFLQASNFNNLNLKSLPYVIENFSVGEHHVAVNTLVSDLSNAVCSGNISQGETAFVDSFLSERDYDCILAESERNRLCHLLWSFRLNSSNKFIGNDCELLAYQHSFTEFMNVCLSSFIDGLFKEILEHLSKSTSSLSASSLIELIHRYVTENNESVEGQNISNLSKHLYEFLNLFTFNHRQLVNDYQVGQKLFPVQRKLGETQSESELLCFENLCLRKQNYLLSMKDYVVAVNSGDFVASFWKDVRSITDDSESLTSSSLPIQDGCELNITKSSIITNCKFDTSTSLFGNSLKQQLCAFEHVISGTFNHLCNQIEAMIIKIQRIESKMNDFEHFQLLVDKQKDYSLDNKECFNQLEMELINLQRRNDEWVINVNSMFSSLSLLMTSHSYNGIPTELSSNYNTNELSTGHYSSNVLHPNEIMLNFDLFINDFQDQVNKMAIAKSQCDHLSSEIIRLQTSINRQNSQIDMYANIVNNLVAKISEISTEMLESNVTGDGGDENKIDFERSQCLNGNFSLRLNTDIGLTMEKIKVNLDQLNFLRLKLIASKQEDEMKERELEISKSEQMKILDQSNGSVEENKKNVCSTHQCAILNYRSEDIEPVSECIKSHIQSTFHYKTLLDKEPTFEQTTTSFTSTTSFLHTKQISGISGLSNLIYPRRAEKTSISELVGSVDHLRNLHELRSLAKYLLDQYHIVTSELELQSNTNWCLRQRLENANCQRDQLIGLLNKNSQALSSIEESLNMTMDESSSYSKNYDGICQKSLSNLRNKHKTNGQPFDFTRASDKYSVEYCHAPFHQATGNKFMPKSKVSSMKSRISDSDHFIINEMFVPTKMMQSVSSQTVKCRNGSCFPSRKFACGPILKRFSGRHHSRRRHQLSSVCANQSSNNPKQYSHRVNNKESRNTDLAILSIASIRSSEQLDKKNDTNTNVFTSHWDKLETGQRKLHTVSISIEKEFEHYQSESLFFPFSSSMIDESDKQFETHSLLHEYKNNTDESKKDKNNELPEVRTVKSESSTLRKHSPTSSSLSFKSVDSHFYSGGQLSVKSRKLKFHSRFINMLRSSFKKS
ncbi:golgin subfamily B member 1 [Schistosoma japonicum]|nr:golgin subfamily B member 1 [Schistosoma japonicum]